MSTASFPSGLIAKAQSHVSHIIELSCSLSEPRFIYLSPPQPYNSKKWGWGQKASSFTHWGPYLKLSIWVLMFLPAFAFEGDPINPIYYIHFFPQKCWSPTTCSLSTDWPTALPITSFYWTRREVGCLWGPKTMCCPSTWWTSIWTCNW